MKKMFVIPLLLVTFGCAQLSTERVSLPKDNFVIIAHRGASAYAPDHTLSSYNMAVQMGADYIELDVQLTKDGKLVAFHDTVISLHNRKRSVADITLDELQLFSLGETFNDDNPLYASVTYEELHVITLDEVLQHFGSTVNYYIEIKSPDSYPSIEVELLHQLREHGLLHLKGGMPKVIIQSFDGNSLKKIFDMEPSIPLIKLYTFNKDARLSKKELQKLEDYASGVGVNADAVTHKFIESMHRKGLDVHAFTVNDEKTIRALITLGVDGLFTDKPDIAVEVKNEKSSMDTE